MSRILSFLKPYRWQMVLMILLLFTHTLGTLYVPTLTADIVNNGIVRGDLDHVWHTGGFMLLVSVASSLIAVLSTYTSTYISTGMGRDIRCALFRKTQEFSAGDFGKFGAASLITRSTNDVTQVQTAFSIVVEMLLPAPFMTVAGLVLAFSKNRVLALMLLGAMVLILAVMALVAKKIIPIFENLQAMLDNINRTVRESIIGVRVIRAFNRAEHEKERTDATFSDYASLAIKANKIFAVLMPLIMLAMNLLSLLFIWFGGRQVAAGQMEIGDIMAMIEYAMLTLMYLIMGVTTFLFIPRALTCAKRIGEVLSVEPELTQRESQNDTAEDSKLKAVFDHVTFRYAGAEEPVLHDLSFTVESGKTTAIIGSTGSGKSTIANLMMRFYDVEDGRILIDGRDVRSYPLNDLRDKIGYVPQKAFLFSGTIADNLRHGQPDASEDEMHHAAETAQIGDFIESKPEGFAYPVSQGGSNFSGGQKQRLSIARALIKKPDIYLFDDSFSALDFKTDAKLRAALKSEVKNSAVVIVAQRISTILDAEQILVLDEGRIVGKGTHKELMQSCAVYQQIAKSQLSEEELA